MQFANEEAEDYGDDEYRELGYNLPPCEFQPSSAWYDPNQGRYYLPPQNYPLPDPVIWNTFDQERYTARLANHYQSVTEQNAKVAEDKTAHAKQEIEWLHQTIQQQSTLQNQSQFSAPAQFSTPNANAMLAGQLGSQTAVSAAPPVLSQSAMTIPAADLPAGTYSIYCLLPNPATVTQCVDPECNRWTSHQVCSCAPICHSPHLMSKCPMPNCCTE